MASHPTTRFLTRHWISRGRILARLRAPRASVLSAFVLAAVSVVPGPALHAELSTVYLGTGGPGAKGIYRAAFDTATGKLSAATLAAEVGSAGFLALHPRGDRLYATASLDGTVGAAGYRIEGDGSLTLINAVASGDGAAAHIAVHPSGTLAVTAQYGGGSVAVYPIDAEGRLGTARVIEHTDASRVVPRRQDAPHPHQCVFSPDGRFALVPDLGADGVVLYRVDAANGSFVRHGFAASVPGGGARHLRFAPDGRAFHLLNELTLSVTTFAWDATTGEATRAATVAALTADEQAGEAFNSAAEIVVHPSGRWYYTSNRGHDTVAVFASDPAGTPLRRIQLQPVRGAFPRNIALAPGGGWLLAAGADSHTLSVHRVDQTSGRLTYQTKGVINVPAPICIVFARPAGGTAP
jgi:6-phosphogluconolactonase